jgi:hypothetical protein
MMLDQRLNHLLDLGTIGFHFGDDVLKDAEIVRATRGWLLLGVEFAVWRAEGAVLEIVDAHLGCLAETDGAQVSGHFHVELVGFVDSGAQLIRRDIDVCLDGGETDGMPIAHKGARFIGILQHMHLRNKARRAFQIWSR